MSMNILEHNFNLVSGLKLPVLYIEQATVNNSSIDLKVSFYIRQRIDEDPGSILAELMNVEFYVQQVLDGAAVNVEGATGDDTGALYSDDELGGTSRLEDLVSGKGSILEYYMKSLSVSRDIEYFNLGDQETAFTGCKNPLVLGINDFSIAEQETQEVFRTIKYTAEVTTTVRRTQEADSIFSVPGNLTFGFVTYSSTLDMSGPGLTTLYNSIVETPRLIRLYTPFFSQLSYQRIFQAGRLKASPTKIFVFENTGKIYDGDAIQTIDGGFHTSVNITREEMVIEFSGLLAETTDSSDAFAAAVDSFNYLLAVYGTTEELLPRLDILRRTYLDKSTATPMGRWYQTFNTALIRVNSKAMNSALLRRELVTTPVVVSNISPAETGYSEPVHLGYSVNNHYVWCGEGSVLMSRIGHHAFEDVGSQVRPDELADYNYTLIENGYFFFDYEKAVRQESVISKVFNIDYLQNFFDSSIINKYYKVSQAVMTRKDTDDNNVFVKNSIFNDDISATYPELIETTYINYNAATASPAKSSYDQDGTTIYPELMLRNMHIPGNEAINGYRLMTFQFQDIMDSGGPFGDSPRDNDELHIKVICKDYTKKLIDEVVSSFTSMITGSYAEYFELAEEFCSYNNVDGYFNQFFIDAMESKYGGDPSSAPWVTMPIIYNMHLDIINGTFGGSMEKITDASILISEQLAPSTGRIENLISFNENLQSITDFYNSETFIATLEQYSEQETIEFGDGGIPVEISSYPLPDFLNLAGAINQLPITNPLDYPVKMLSEDEHSIGRWYNEGGQPDRGGRDDKDINNVIAAIQSDADLYFSDEDQAYFEQIGYLMADRAERAASHAAIWGLDQVFFIDGHESTSYGFTEEVLYGDDEESSFPNWLFAADTTADNTTNQSRVKDNLMRGVTSYYVTMAIYKKNDDDDNDRWFRAQLWVGDSRIVS